MRRSDVTGKRFEWELGEIIFHCISQLGENIGDQGYCASQNWQYIVQPITPDIRIQYLLTFSCGDAMRRLTLHMFSFRARMGAGSQLTVRYQVMGSTYNANIHILLGACDPSQLTVGHEWKLLALV